MHKSSVIMLLILTQMSGAKDYSACGSNKLSKQLAQHIIEAKGQNRVALVCNQKLSKIALLKAQELAKKDKIDHNIDHISPNQFLTQHGVKLPFVYEHVGNQVEAIQGGMQTAKEAFEYFLTSEEHKSQILGENEFYKSQNQMGIGYYSDKSKRYEDYWVVYIVELRNENDKANGDIKIKYVFEKNRRSKTSIRKNTQAKRKKRELNNSSPFTRTKF